MGKAQVWHTPWCADMAQPTPLPPLQGGMTGWVAFSLPSLEVPAWLVAAMPHEGPMWWRGLLSFLDPLMHRCADLAAPHLDNFIEGLGIPAHPTQPHLFTKCLVPTNLTRMLGQYSGRFRHVRKGSGRGAKAGCIKLKQHGITVAVGTMALPCQEVYVSRLLCYMYRGPPPSPELEACHVCELRMCMAPWHLDWHTHQSNTQGYFVHKMNRERYHPYHQPQPAA